MLIFIFKRIGFMAVTMIVVSMLLFALLETGLAGDVAVRVLGDYATEEQRELWREDNGYNEPVVLRYFSWLEGFVTGDLGDSTRFKAPVEEVLVPRLWNTIVLGFWVFALMVPISLTLGVLAGMREGSGMDRSICVLSIITTSVPEFASTVLFSFIFVFSLQWLPGTSGMSAGFDWKQMVLPVMVLVVYDLGYITRMTRASMAEVMTTHYIRTAILKGLPHSTVILRHALRNALIAPFTVIMLQVNWLLSGVIVVEFYFGYKGFGALLLEASLNNDINLIEACTMVAVFLAVTSQSAADIVYTYLNPRIRFG